MPTRTSPVDTRNGGVRMSSAGSTFEDRLLRRNCTFITTPVMSKRKPKNAITLPFRPMWGCLEYILPGLPVASVFIHSAHPTGDYGDAGMNAY
jgi:hypothetical protein